MWHKLIFKQRFSRIFFFLHSFETALLNFMVSSKVLRRNGSRTPCLVPACVIITHVVMKCFYLCMFPAGKYLTFHLNRPLLSRSTVRLDEKKIACFFYIEELINQMPSCSTCQPYIFGQIDLKFILSYCSAIKCSCSRLNITPNITHQPTSVSTKNYYRFQTKWNLFEIKMQIRQKWHEIIKCSECEPHSVNLQTKARSNTPK